MLLNCQNTTFQISEPVLELGHDLLLYLIGGLFAQVFGEGVIVHNGRDLHQDVIIDLFNQCFIRHLLLVRLYRLQVEISRVL